MPVRPIFFNSIPLFIELFHTYSSNEYKELLFIHLGLDKSIKEHKEPQSFLSENNFDDKIKSQLFLLLIFNVLFHFLYLFKIVILCNILLLINIYN